jgi:hypothetical protein
MVSDARGGLGGTSGGRVTGLFQVSAMLKVGLVKGDGIIGASDPTIARIPAP